MAKEQPDAKKTHDAKAKHTDEPDTLDAKPAPQPVVVPDLNFTDGTGAKSFPIKVWQEGDIYQTYLHEAPKDREVRIGGLWFDHVDTSPDGVWIYRNDRKN